MKGYAGFMTLDAMLVLWGGVCCLSTLIFFHASYMQIVRRALLRTEAIEHAQLVLGYVRNGEAVPHNALPPLWNYEIADLQAAVYGDTRWVSVTVKREDMKYSLISVCI